MKKIFPILIAHHFQRALVLGTNAYAAPQDKGALKWRAVALLIKAVGGSGYEEFKQIGTYVASQDVKAIKWTVFRVPFLGNGPEAPVKATWTGTGEDGLGSSRKSMAAWVLGEMRGHSEWAGKAPMLSN